MKNAAGAPAGDEMHCHMATRALVATAIFIVLL